MPASRSALLYADRQSFQGVPSLLRSTESSGAGFRFSYSLFNAVCRSGVIGTRARLTILGIAAFDGDG